MIQKSQSVRLEPLLVIAFLSLADTSFVSPILSAYARSIGASSFEAGLIVGIYPIVAIPATIFMGYLIDRVGRKKILAPLFIGDAISIYLYSLSQAPWQLMLVRALNSIFDSGIFPASISIFRDAISGRRVGRYMGLYWVFVSTAVAIGSSTATALVASMGFGVVFVLLSILMIFGLIASILARDVYPTSRARRDVSFSVLRGYLAKLVPSYIAAFALYISIGAVTGSLSSNLARYLGLDLRSAGVATGIYMAIASLIAIPANIVAGLISDRRGARSALSIGLAFLLVSMAVLSLRLDPAARYIAATAQGMAIAIVFVASSQIATDVPETARASSAAILSVMLLLGVAIGSPVTGYLAGSSSIAVGSITLFPSFLLPAILALVSIIAIAGLSEEQNGGTKQDGLAL